MTSATSGVLRFTDNASNRFILEQCAEIGGLLLTRDGGRGGRITNIYSAGGDIAVEGAWWVDPQPADVLLCPDGPGFLA